MGWFQQLGEQLAPNLSMHHTPSRELLSGPIDKQCQLDLCLRVGLRAARDGKLSARSDLLYGSHKSLETMKPHVKLGRENTAYRSFLSADPTVSRSLTSRI